jgi:nucleotide-binding universal stress UspA family protein
MVYRTILVDLANDSGLEPRLQVARNLAGRFDAVLVGMHVMLPPFIPGAYGEAAAYVGTDLIEAQRAANQEIRDRVHAVFRNLCGEGANALWQEAEGYRDDLLAEAAKTADLVLASRAKAGGTEVPDVLDRLVTAAGIPVLALPTDASIDLGLMVLVGWNGSREAARAVHEGLPFLREAERVILLAIGEVAADSVEAGAAMLRRHGVTVEPQRIEGPDRDAGEVLLAQAAAHGADLLVMGAYGHSRLRELVFGGATRHLLREATLPVLFSS